MTINDVGLSTLTVESQQYPFVRTLTFVLPSEPSAAVQSFVDYTLSPSGPIHLRPALWARAQVTRHNFPFYTHFTTS